MPKMGCLVTKPLQDTIRQPFILSDAEPITFAIDIPSPRAHRKQCDCCRDGQILRAECHYCDHVAPRLSGDSALLAWSVASG